MPRNSPLTLLRAVVKLLLKQQRQFCLVGGHAASLYRKQERMTRDIDFAFIGDPESESRAQAEQIVEQLGFRPTVGFIPAVAEEAQRDGLCMVSAAPAAGEISGAIDFLLPALPWVEAAVRRAQSNCLDLGFAKVPVITPEDLIVAKCYALRNSPDRFQDLDDLKEIFLNDPELDLRYLKLQLAAHKLSIPKQVKKFLPRR